MIMKRIAKTPSWRNSFMDKIEALRIATEKRVKNKKAQLNNALSKMLKGNKLISVSTVADEACVSRTYIYKNKEILNEIKIIEEKQQAYGKIPCITPKSERSSEKSKDAIIAALNLKITELKDKNKDLSNEVSRLNEALSIAYGKLRENGI